MICKERYYWKLFSIRISYRVVQQRLAKCEMTSQHRIEYSLNYFGNLFSEYISGRLSVNYTYELHIPAEHPSHIVNTKCPTTLRMFKYTHYHFADSLIDSLLTVFPVITIIASGTVANFTTISVFTIIIINCHYNAIIINITLFIYYWEQPISTVFS